MRLASKLRKAVPEIAVELVWETAVIASLLDEMLVTDLISNVRSGSVKNPRKYVAAATRKTCEERKIRFEQLRELLPESPARTANVNS